MESDDVTFVIWDMGGQDRYRKKYIEYPDRYFIDVQSVIYVIDVQDKEKYDLSQDYLAKLVEIFEGFEEYPDFFIFLHKADPEIYEKLKPDLAVCEDFVTKIFENRPFEHRIFHTSIYNTAISGENFADSLANLFELSNRTDDTSADLLNSLQLVYNNIIKISYVLEGFENRLSRIESQIATGGVAPEIPAKAAPPSATTPALKSIEEPVIPPRQALLGELKSLFRRKGIGE
jgi:hypothetical protein